MSINRNTIEDTKKIIESFILNENIRKIVLEFLTDAIIYANTIRPNNWNLNLNRSDKSRVCS